MLAKLCFGRSLRHNFPAYRVAVCSRYFTTGRMAEEKFKPARRVAGQRQDVWSIINEAAAASPKQPIVNMGQGFL